MARYAHMFVVMVVLLLISASSLVEAAAGAGGEKTCPKAGVDMLKVRVFLGVHYITMRRQSEQ